MIRGYALLEITDAYAGAITASLISQIPSANIYNDLAPNAGITTAAEQIMDEVNERLKSIDIVYGQVEIHDVVDNMIMLANALPVGSKDYGSPTNETSASLVSDIKCYVADMCSATEFEIDSGLLYTEVIRCVCTYIKSVARILLKLIPSMNIQGMVDDSPTTLKIVEGSFGYYVIIQPIKEDEDNDSAST